VTAATTIRARTSRQYTNEMLDLARSHGFSPPQPGEFAAASRLAAELMKHEVASGGTLERMLALQPASSFVIRAEGEVVGMLGNLLAREPIAAAVWEGRFSGLSPDPAFLCDPDEIPAYYYFWGFAGSTKTGARAASNLQQAIRYEVLSDLTAFGFAASPVGRHVGATKLGFQPLRHPDDDYMISPAVLREAAE
jgi:hypothetical protein